MDNIENESPLRYPGGKARACNVIMEVIEARTDLRQFTHLISPFFGGGSFEFHFQNKYKVPVKANDKFHPLYIFWNAARYKNAQLCDTIEELRPVTEQEFQQYRASILEVEVPVTKAAYYFIVNRCSFSGFTLSGAFSPEASKERFTQTSIGRIRDLDLRFVDFSCQDCNDFINSNANSTSLIFLDPPYYLGNASTLYGADCDLHEPFDHQRLFNTLKLKENWVLCYNDCEYVKELYEGYDIVEVDWKCGMDGSGQLPGLLVLNL